MNKIRDNLTSILPTATGLDPRIKEILNIQCQKEIELITDFLAKYEAIDRDEKNRLYQMKMDEERRLRVERTKQRPLFLEAMREWASPQEDLFLLNDSQDLVKPVLLDEAVTKIPNSD